ncbi:MAG: helix-turn-helix transcriptional regulator [Tyzzerella sp.]|nr:helix-turn-helix transcriptional regulator [Tyzzerella sp.]
MQIGDVIKKYRKEKGITQEEMARRLGVTAPAVSKWENGTSVPDIMLLGPIARLFEISVDTLLSFQEELSPKEIADLMQALDKRFNEESYDEAFHWAKKKLEMYPNCKQLIWQMALVLDARHMTMDVPDSDKYDSYILDWYSQGLSSDDERIKTSAADSLFNYYVRKEEYEKAEEYLKYFSEQNPMRKQKQALIYSKTNRVYEAYKSYEEIVFSSSQMLSLVFNGIYMLAVSEGNMEKARKMIDKQEELARFFEVGRYQEVSPRLDLATLEKDADTVIQTMQEMLASVGELGAFSKSSLYEHMTFKKLDTAFVEDMRDKLLECFRDTETFRFLIGNERWENLVK